MRFPLTVLSLLLFSAIPAYAQQVPSLQERIAVRRDLEQAKMNLRYFWQVEYPRRCRELDGAIECTRAEIDDNRSLLREYRPYTSFSIGEPFPITVRKLQMCIRESELRLNDLIAERNNLVRYHSDQFRILAAQVYEARMRIVELEAPLDETAQSTEALPPQKP